MIRMTFIKVGFVICLCLPYSFAAHATGKSGLPTYTITELYEAAEPSSIIKNSRIIRGNFYINSKSFSFSKNGEWVSYYYNDVQGPQMMKFLRQDSKIDSTALDAFIRQNSSDIKRADLYYDGFMSFNMTKYLIVFPISSETITRFKNMSW